MFKAQGAARLSAPDIGQLVYRSPGLQLIFERISSGDKVNILDLGPPLSSNVEFFSSYHCRLYIADLLQSLSLVDTYWAESPAFSPMFPELLDFDESEQFDIILGWDIVNYLSEDSIRRFSRFIARHTKADALCFFSLLTHKEMAVQPAIHRILEEGSLHCEQHDCGSCASPRFTQSRLLELMKEFQAHRSFLLQNGRQEQVLRIR
ncbi:hypothetical protein JYT96_02150 [Gammaproteobacteria bacterium AH-315-C21]|nr:hypothetical protein [Gammaproteobacteria bacterium AH-315-C21]